MVAWMGSGRVLLFLALGAGLIWWALEIVYDRPILAGVFFPIGVLFVFLAVALAVRDIRERRAQEQGSAAQGGSDSEDRE